MTVKLLITVSSISAECISGLLISVLSVVYMNKGGKKVSKETAVLRWWESIAGNLVLKTELKT